MRNPIRISVKTGWAIRVPTHLVIAHSPDSDDAYMMAPLALGWMDQDSDRQAFTFDFVRLDIEKLNQHSFEELYDISAISFGVYPHIQHQYDLLTAGSSIQEGTGPLIVSRVPLLPEQLSTHTVAIPGMHTSAYLSMQKYHPHLKVQVMAFDQILPSLERGEVHVGLIINESQLMYQQKGLHLVADLGQWWKQQFNLPLPMGGNAIRRALPEEIKLTFARCMKKSVVIARERHWESVDYAQSFGRGMDREMVSRYVTAWVNNFTVDPGIRGRLAVNHLLDLEAIWIQG